MLELELGSVDEFRASKAGSATLRAEWKHDKSVTSAYWDPRGRSIVSTSYDDTLRSTSRHDLISVVSPKKSSFQYSMGSPSVTHGDRCAFPQLQTSHQNQT